MTTRAISAEKVTEHFVAYICENKPDARHVRRVAGWLGFVVGGIDRLADDWGFMHERQFWFTVGSRKYKIRFNHRIGFRGGLQIVEMADWRTDGRVALELRSQEEAEEFYNRPTLAPSQRVMAAA